MRIIAGRLGGRTFDSPHGQRTHPMSDKIRGALFNALGDIDGLTVLDAFTGSGALAFEAISRNAASVVALDIDRSAITAVIKSLQELGITDKVKAVRANAAAWLRTQPNQHFNVVLCDPPYDDIQISLLTNLAERAEKGGVIVLSLPPRHGFSLPSESYTLLLEKDYGDATLAFYRRIA